MSINIKTIVDAFLTRVNWVNFNIAEDINNLQNSVYQIAYGVVGQSGFANTETLSANKTLTDDDRVLQTLNPNTADRTITLPAIAVTNHPFLITNTNGSNFKLTVENASATHVRVVPPGKSYLFFSNGSSWKVVGQDLYTTISPAQITADQNDYNPTSAYLADILRLNSNAARSITGLAGGTMGRRKVLHNIGSFTITLVNESASSSAANRFAIGANYGLIAGGSVKLIYDDASSRWRPIGLTPPTGTIVGTSDTQTLTNKRIDARVASEASNATPTPNADTTDVHLITAQAAAAAFAAPTGTPTQGQKLLIRIKDNGTARALSWNAIYRAVGTALPVTTVLSKTLYLGFIYNSTDSKWDLVGAAQE